MTARSAMWRRLMHLAALLSLSFLAGCGGGGGEWVKAGADSATTANEYDDCTDLARTATSKEAEIDQDIAATRGADIQRSYAVLARTTQMADKTRRSADAVVDACMRQKGFHPADERPGGFKGLRKLFD